MAEFRPFRGIFFNKERTGELSQVICPPYDVISPEEQDYFHDLHPNNAIRLDFGKTFPEDNEQENRYTRSGAFFRQWLSEGTLFQDAAPSFYLLEEHFEDDQGQPLVRYGIMGLKRLEENRPGASIRPHEATYTGPKQDRFELMKATSANFSPIFAVYQDPSFAVEKLFEKGAPHGEYMEAMGYDKVRRRLFAVRDKHILEQMETFLGEKELLIADGHHRYETALTYRDWRKAGEANTGEVQPCDFTLMYITNIESPGLCVYPAHRILKNYPDLDPERFFQSVKEIFDVQTVASSEDPDCRDKLLALFREVPEGAVRIGCRFKDPDITCILSCDDVTKLTDLFPRDIPSLVRTLDVSILHEIVLGKCMGLSGEAQKQEDTLVYIKGEEAALDSLEEKRDLRAAFLLNPAPVKKIMQIAFAGILLPQKTTYFFPKLMTGLVFRGMEEG